MEIKQYRNKDITVNWEPAKCIHSGICFKGLPRVFNPKKKPWITLEEADTERIIEQVNQCPSGAISYQHNKESNNENNEVSVNVPDLKVQITPGGPILLHGNFVLEHGNELKPVNAKVTALCRCGHSKNKPFCDGSHHRVKFDA